jgi:outer membrane protein OmpA-like peptidoglycan-associated protein
MLNEKGDGGYLSSNRETTMKDMIYAFKKIDLRFTVDGIVVEKNTDKPIEGANVVLANKFTGNSETIVTGPDGKFMFKLDQETDFLISGYKDEYFTNKEAISTKGKTVSEDMTVKLKIAIENIIIDKPIAIDLIYYDYNKWDIRPDAAKDLDKLVAILEDNPGIKIELSSHTDSRADDKYNLYLSKKRAEAAVAYIISQGIAKDRLIPKGYGESKPVNHCTNDVKCTPTEHQLNRRTEFKVISIEKRGVVTLSDERR